MKVAKAEEITGKWITTDNLEEYIRWSCDSWEKVYGNSTECVFDTRELEAAYQEYIKEQK